jgi:hypothetical protein
MRLRLLYLDHINAPNSKAKSKNGAVHLEDAEKLPALLNRLQPV